MVKEGRKGPQRERAGVPELAGPWPATAVRRE